MRCTDWGHLCIIQKEKERWRERGDTQIYGSTAWIFHLPADVSITFSQGIHYGFCNAREPLACQAWQPWESEFESKKNITGKVRSLVMVAGQLRGDRGVGLLGFLVIFEKTPGVCVVLYGLAWQVSLRGSQARDRILIPGGTAQPSVPILPLLLVHDGKEKYPSLLFSLPCEKHPDLNTDSDE